MIAPPANTPAEIQNSHFVSPCCRAQLSTSDTELTCNSCGADFQVDDGLYKFVVAESDHGELSSNDMRALIEKAKTNGWRETLNDIDPSQATRVANLISNPLRRKSVELLQGTGGKVLDFGCGYGGVSMALSDMFDAVVSLDGSLERVSFLNVMRQQEGKSNITPLCHMDVLKLPFPDNYFDAISLIGVLEYLPQTLPDLDTRTAQQKCLESFLRVLRPGGKILVHTKNRFGWQYLRGAKDHSGLRFAPAMPVPLADAILRATGRGPYRIINYSHNGYSQLFRQAGFRDLAFYWPFPGYQMPTDFIDLSVSDVDVLKNSKVSPIKLSAYKALAAAGLLRHLVPNFTIIASK